MYFMFIFHFINNQLFNNTYLHTYIHTYIHYLLTYILLLIVNLNLFTKRPNLPSMAKNILKKIKKLTLQTLTLFNVINPVIERCTNY